MIKTHHCNDCPEWYVTKKRYRYMVGDATYCRKYNQQLYYLYGEKNHSPHPCKQCEKRFSYVPYIVFDEENKETDIGPSEWWRKADCCESK